MSYLASPLMTVRQHRAKVAHGAAGYKEGCFLAHHGRGRLLKPVNSRVISPDVIAHLCLRMQTRRLDDGPRHPRTDGQGSISRPSGNPLQSVSKILSGVRRIEDGSLTSAMALRIAGVGLVTVSLRRSIISARSGFLGLQ